MHPDERESLAANGRLKRKSMSKPRPSAIALNERMSVASRSVSTNYSELRQSLSIGGNLRPNVPANKKKY